MSALTPLAAAPALPLDDAGKYVAGAYLVFVALLLLYVAIMAARLSRIERELAELPAIGDAASPDAAARPATATPTEAATP